MKSLVASKCVKSGPTHTRSAFVLGVLIALLPHQSKAGEGGYNGPSFDSTAVPIESTREILSADVDQAVNTCLVWGRAGAASTLHRLFRDLYGSAATCFVPHFSTDLTNVCHEESYNLRDAPLHACEGGLESRRQYGPAGNPATSGIFASNSRLDFISDWRRSNISFPLWMLQAQANSRQLRWSGLNSIVRDGSEPPASPAPAPRSFIEALADIESGSRTPSQNNASPNPFTLSVFDADANRYVDVRSEGFFPIVRYNPSNEPSRFTEFGTAVGWRNLAKNVRIQIPVDENGQPVQSLRFVNAVTGARAPITLNVTDYIQCVSSETQRLVNYRPALTQ